MSSPRRNFNPARKLAGSLLGVGEAQPPPPPLPKVRIVTTPTTPTTSPSPTPLSGGGGSNLPPFQPLQRLDIPKSSTEHLTPITEDNESRLHPNLDRTRKMTRSASVVSLVPDINREGQTVMKMIFSPDGESVMSSKTYIVISV